MTRNRRQSDRRFGTPDPYAARRGRDPFGSTDPYDPHSPRQASSRHARTGHAPRTSRHAGSHRTVQRSIPFDEVPRAHRSDKHAHPKHGRGRSKNATLVENAASKSRRRKFVVIFGILCVILIVALCVGVFAFFRTTDSNLALEDSNAKDALVAAKPDEPYFVLCVADMDDPATKRVESESEGYMLVRVDAKSKTLTFITVPAILTAKMSDGANHSLFEARQVGGDADLVRAISDLCDIGINHFISTNSDHIVNMVDMMGGVTMDLSEEIDDPNAGTEVIFSGEQTLNGKQVLTFLRATNVTGGFDTTVANRVFFTTYVLDEAVSSSGLGLANLVGDASRYIGTDMSTSDLLAMGDALKPVDDLTVYSCIVPYYETRGTSTDDKVFQVSASSWDTIRNLVMEGADPNATDESASNVVPSEVTVEVRNGTQMTGAGAKLGEILQGYGYDVIGVGNVTDGTMYPETLIVYTAKEFEGAAKAIAAQIGNGRVVNGGDYYSSDAGVIAIIGLDYIPAV